MKKIVSCSLSGSLPHFSEGWDRMIEASCVYPFTHTVVNQRMTEQSVGNIVNVLLDNKCKDKRKKHIQLKVLFYLFSHLFQGGDGCECVRHVCVY